MIQPYHTHSRCKFLEIQILIFTKRNTRRITQTTMQLVTLKVSGKVCKCRPQIQVATNISTIPLFPHSFYGSLNIFRKEVYFDIMQPHSGILKEKHPQHTQCFCLLCSRPQYVHKIDILVAIMIFRSFGTLLFFICIINSFPCFYTVLIIIILMAA